MAELRALFTALGMSDVSTVIASGNVLFSTRAADRARLERRIEAHLETHLGYPVSTFLRSGAELEAAAGHVPFPAMPTLPAGHALSVLFLKAAPSAPAQQALLELGTPTDEFHLHGREAYWWRRGRISDSKVTVRHLEMALGGPLTARNITTVRKLAAAATTA